MDTLGAGFLSSVERLTMRVSDTHGTAACYIIACDACAFLWLLLAKRYTHFAIIVKPPIWTLRDMDCLYTMCGKTLIDFALEIIYNFNLQDTDNLLSPDDRQKMCKGKTVYKHSPCSNTCDIK